MTTSGDDLLSERVAGGILPKVLTTFDMVAIFVAIVLFITNAAVIQSAGPAAFGWWIIAFVFAAGLAYLLQGNAAATNPWDFAAWSPSAEHGINLGNWSFFGLAVLALLGVEVPLNMGVEIRQDRAVTRYLLWGGCPGPSRTSTRRRCRTWRSGSARGGALLYLLGAGGRRKGPA
ncbi:hypothetical protein [Nonomuraea sp. NPDC049028]|uniref:hypothetical protein n=1 Tax=Nonomuraea sp. NPDC049028 TaxID=3364348 RepID=UPI00371C1523